MALLWTDTGSTSTLSLLFFSCLSFICSTNLSLSMSLSWASEIQVWDNSRKTVSLLVFLCNTAIRLNCLSSPKLRLAHRKLRRCLFSPQIGRFLFCCVSVNARVKPAGYTPHYLAQVSLNQSTEGNPRAPAAAPELLFLLLHHLFKREMLEGEKECGCDTEVDSSSFLLSLAAANMNSLQS